MYVAVVCALLITAHLTRVTANIDYNVCNPLNATIVPPPPPQLDKSYTTRVEWKWVDTNTTVDVYEVYNGIIDTSSQHMYIEGQEIKIIYDYKESQYITYTKAGGCIVNGLGTLAFYDNKIWLTAFKLLYTITRRADVAYMGQVTVRSTLTEQFRACLYLFQFNITVQIDMYFSAFGWGMALSRPDEMIPVRLEMKGSTTHNNTKEGIVPFHVVGDFIEFNPSPLKYQTEMQVPPGTFCPGRLSRKPINILPPSFSIVLEKIDMDYSRITYETIWFDSEKRLVRRDYKEASGNDPDPTTQIYDFNLGIHYSIDPYMGSCQPVNQLYMGDRFVASNGKSTIRMMTTDEYFHIRHANIQYVGSRVARGVECDVWAGMYLDGATDRNFTIEWYFTKDHWLEAVGSIIQPASLFRLDIYEGSDKPSVMNVLKFNSEAPAQDVFDLTHCFPSSKQSRLLVHFAVVNNGSLDTVSYSYLKETLHIQLVTKALLAPLRISRVSIESVGMTDVYFDGILLEHAPFTNPNIVPAPPKQHTLEAAFEFLKGAIGGNFKLRINSTTLSRLPVILESRGILKIDYTEEFITTPTSTTLSTTEATPPLPHPTTTMKPHTPPTRSLITNVTPSSTTCSCPTPVCPTTKSIVIGHSTPCHTPSAKTECPATACPSNPTCPTVSCPALSKQTCPPISQLKCPTITTATKCPTTRPCTTSRVSRTPCPKAQKPSPCQTVNCSPPCPTVSTQHPVKCPTVICPTIPGCPTSRVNRTPSPTTPTPSPCPVSVGQQQQQQQHSKNNSSGIAGGVVAVIAIVMLIIGLFCGVAVIVVYKRYRNPSPDKRTILDKYLDSEEKY